MEIRYTGLKIIHWEYDKPLLGKIMTADTGYRLSYVVKPGTDIKNGIYFKWIVKLYSPKGLFINCIGEDVYLIEPLQNLDYFSAYNTINMAFENFQDAFLLKLKAEKLDHLIAGIAYTIKNFEVFKLMDIFK